MPTVFFTGFPGFLGSELLPRILQRSPDTTALCLVQPKFADLARERARALGNRIRLIEGDITAPIDAQTADVIEVFHLAAIYDLAVPRERGMKINVEGTRNVLDFAERCPSLQRFHYVSTCYVSGRYDGVFHEDDLDVGQTFNNFYEETKFLAEVEVRKRSLPMTIYRPTVVVGDSTTGATQKFDGPYYVMQWLLRQPRVAILPVVGRPSRYRFNVVPRDFIIAAIAELSKNGESKCYQLADPAPLTVDETIDVIARAARRHVVRLPLPRSVAKFAIDRIPGVYRLMRIPSAAIDYFVHPTTYDTTNAQRDLRLRVPRLSEYAERLVAFAEGHPEISASGMA
jgi:nucleoside-diphosphate-sugar epimerase